MFTVGARRTMLATGRLPQQGQTPGVQWLQGSRFEAAGQRRPHHLQGSGDQGQEGAVPGTGLAGEEGSGQGVEPFVVGTGEGSQS